MRILGMIGLALAMTLTAQAVSPESTIQVAASGWMTIQGDAAARLFNHLKIPGQDRSSDYTHGVTECLKSGPNIDCKRTQWPGEDAKFLCHLVIDENGKAFDQALWEEPKTLPSCR